MYFFYKYTIEETTVLKRLRKKIPYTSAVHMPFKNAVVYILLYGTAECYYFQKTLDKDFIIPTICTAPDT